MVYMKRQREIMKRFKANGREYESGFGVNRREKLNEERRVRGNRRDSLNGINLRSVTEILRDYCSEK